MPKLLSTLFCLILSAFVFAQNTVPENATVAAARDYAVRSYYRFTGLQSRLYNGVEHTGYLNSIKGHAYFNTDSLLRGNIRYDGMFFSPVEMRYDIYKDEVIIKHFSGLQIALLTEKVDDFSLDGHEFTHHNYDSISRTGMTTGIYERMFTGKNFTVFARRVKKLEEKVTDEVVREFVQDDYYYLYRDGKYLYFKTKPAFLKALGPQARAVRKHLRKKKLNYRKDRDAAILEAVAYIDQSN